MDDRVLFVVSSVNGRQKTYAKYEGSVTKDDIWLAIATIAANTITASASGTLIVVAPAPESRIMDVHRHVSCCTVYRNKG